MASFASDNTAPAHPSVIAAIQAANTGHAKAYGDDPWTARAVERVQALLGSDVPASCVWNGTGANVTGLGHLVRAHHGILCVDDAHIAVDECGAPERFTGAKLIDLPTSDGKLQVAQLEPLLSGVGVEHHVQPKVVALTQATERGTVYSIEELKQLSAWAHRHGLLVHMDGARLANATVALGGDLRATTRAVGVDVLTFGFTKNGGMGAEVVAFLNPALGEEFRYTRKQGMQLASKMRFLGAQVDALLTDGLWLTLAANANQMARRLATGASKVAGVRLSRMPEANGVFAHLKDDLIPKLQERHRFYVWKAGSDGTSEVRWMCSWDTTEQDVDAFVRDIGEVCG